MANFTTQVKVTLDPALINPFLADVTNLSAKMAAERVRDRARANAPHGSGRLAKSINIRKVEDGAKTTYEVGSNLDYAKYQEEGTGPIVPVRAKVLRFKVGGKTIFTKRTRGVPATHFLRRAYQTLTLRDYSP